MSRIVRTFRNFAELRRTANSARVLNLLDPTLALEDKAGAGADRNFFFNSYVLNHTFILKHRLRPQEMDIFANERTVGTKIFVPFDTTDLRVGGKYVFINEKGAEAIYHANFGVEGEQSPNQTYLDVQDIRLLDIIDNLPSLDPFILRERIRMYGYNPDGAYFEISNHEFEEIRESIEMDFAPLISRAFTQKTMEGKLSAFVKKLWDAEDATEMLPLLTTMQIKEEQFVETIFSWKGFIFYKSILGKISKDFIQLLSAINTAKIIGLKENPNGSLIISLQEATVTGLRQEMKTATAYIKMYEEAYFDGLIRSEDPKKFRTFLKEAPQLFQILGASLGAMRHAISFWKYRFGGFKTAECDAQEFMEIMRDFAQGITDSQNNDIGKLLQETAQANSKE